MTVLIASDWPTADSSGALLPLHYVLKERPNAVRLMVARRCEPGLLDRALPKGLRGTWTRRARAAAWDSLRRGGPELIVAHRLHTAVQVPRELRSTSRLIVQDVISPKIALTSRVHSTLGHAQRTRYLFLEKIIYRQFGELVVVSKPEARSLMALGVPPSKIRVVPNGVDIPVSVWQPPQRSLMKALYFGRLDSTRNQEAINLASAILAGVRGRSGLDVSLVVVGRGQAPKRLASLDNVEIVGEVEDLLGVARQCDFMLNPQTPAAGVKNSVLACMALGMPCIVSAAVAEGLGLAGSDALAISDDAVGYGSRIARLLEAPSEAVRMGEAARALASSRFSWSAYADAVTSPLVA